MAPLTPSRTIEEGSFMSRIGVAVIGYGWMGKAHSQGYLRSAHHYPDLPGVDLIAVAEPEADRQQDAIDRYGFQRAVADWRELLNDPSIQAVSITAPNAFHRELGVAFAEAGKHIWIEKPVGLSSADAWAVADAVAAAGVQSAVGFNYRNAPAVEYAKQLIADGALGELTHARFRFFSDYSGHPMGPLSWRFEKELGGPGVLGDLVSHAADLVRYVVGDIASLVSETATFIQERPLPSGTGSHFDIATGGPMGPVKNEDVAIALLRTTEGVRVVLEASRIAVGDQNNYGFEIHGTKGLVRWDFRRMGELELGYGDTYANQMMQTMYVGPGQGEFGSFQPGAAIAMGYDDTKVIEAGRFLESIATGKHRGSQVRDAAIAADVIEAMIESAATHAWVTL
jgi:predicted dehydrogenase